MKKAKKFKKVEYLDIVNAMIGDRDKEITNLKELVNTMRSVIAQHRINSESDERKTITDQMIIEFLSKQIPNVDALLFQFMRNEYADLLGATI